jgi:hypothetical protein
MMLNDDIIIVSENVAIVRTQDDFCALPTPMTINDLFALYGTVSLPVAQSAPVVVADIANVRNVFGSWAVCGNEDEQLAELYKSRLIPSLSHDD